MTTQRHAKKGMARVLKARERAASALVANCPAVARVAILRRDAVDRWEGRGTMNEEPRCTEHGTPFISPGVCPFCCEDKQAMTSNEVVTEAEALRLLAARERDLGFTGYADWLEAGCPPGTDHEYPQEKLDDIRFYVAAARPSAQPNAELGSLLREVADTGLDASRFDPARRATIIAARAWVKINRCEPQDLPARMEPWARELARRLNEGCDLIDELAAQAMSAGTAETQSGSGPKDRQRGGGAMRPEGTGQ